MWSACNLVTLHLFDTVESIVQGLDSAGFTVTAFVWRDPLLHLGHRDHRLFVILPYAVICVLTATHIQITQRNRKQSLWAEMYIKA